MSFSRQPPCRQQLVHAGVHRTLALPPCSDWPGGWLQQQARSALPGRAHLPVAAAAAPCSACTDHTHPPGTRQPCAARCLVAVTTYRSGRPFPDIRAVLRGTPEIVAALKASHRLVEIVHPCERGGRCGFLSLAQDWQICAHPSTSNARALRHGPTLQACRLPQPATAPTYHILFPC